MTVTDPDPPAAPAALRAERGLGLAIILGLMLLSVVMVAVAGWWLLSTKFSSAASEATSTVAAPSPPLITASGTRLSLTTDPQHTPLEVVHISQPGRRQQELRWDVTLLNVPIGKPLDLQGEWLDPRGRVMHRNGYRTKTVMHDPWNTHVRYQLPGDAAVGAWRVRLLRGGQTIAEQVFQVERP